MILDFNLNFFRNFKYFFILNVVFYLKKII